MVLVVKKPPVNAEDIKKKKRIKSLEWQKAQQWTKNSEAQKQLLDIKYTITDMKIQQKLRK